jgi:hypothetical protein
MGAMMDKPASIAWLLGGDWFGLGLCGVPDGVAEGGAAEGEGALVGEEVDVAAG